MIICCSFISYGISSDLTRAADTWIFLFSIFFLSLFLVCQVFQRVYYLAKQKAPKDIINNNTRVKRARCRLLTF